MNEIEMHDLMLKSLAGDSIAHRRLLSSLAARLQVYVGRRLFSDPDAVDDIVQEILLAVHQRRESYDPGRPLAAWVYAIARFKMTDYLRQRGRRGHRVSLDAAKFVVAESDVEVGLTRRDLGRLMAQLPEKQRKAIQMVKIDGRPIRDVAESESMSETDVKVSIHRGLKKLSKLVDMP
jgi:RNA polymerase sigma-70 factor (ECF subfamily)